MVEVKKISEKNNQLKLLVSDTDATLVNSIRRAVLAEIPTLAIENVSFYENSSIMPDEMLAHRLGMLPIKTESKKLKEGEAIKFVLEKEGPGTVYSKDIKSTDPKTYIADKKIPLTKLKKDQKIKMEMDAIIGKGKDHAKWQPAVIGYRNIAEIAVGKECNLCKDCIEACPKKLLETKGKTIVLKDAAECDMCGECKDNCKAAQLKIKEKENAFILMVESTQAMENSEILEAAINKLEEKTEEFRKALKDL